MIEPAISNTIYAVTGAAGHLGNTIIRQLIRKGMRVRALVLKGVSPNMQFPKNVDIFIGDVRNLESLRPFFQTESGEELIVIHAAGIVSISSRFDPLVYAVNVNGTENVLKLCSEYKVKKLVHVSSVHAIPELPNGRVIKEVDTFDPNKVVGLYAKTKAEATSLVLNAAKKGLNASVVHPSGICGPYDYGNGHLTQLLIDYCKGSLFACVKGGYDFADVRDIAAGIITCTDKGRPGECYILSGRFISIQKLLYTFHILTGKKEIKVLLPMWLARATAPLSEVYYRIMKQPPLFTSYSLYTLSANALFSHEKAQKELGYTLRPLEKTVEDTIVWLKTHRRI